MCRLLLLMYGTLVCKLSRPTRYSFWSWLFTSGKELCWISLFYFDFQHCNWLTDVSKMDVEALLLYQAKNLDTKETALPQMVNSETQTLTWNEMTLQMISDVVSHQVISLDLWESKSCWILSLWVLKHSQSLPALVEKLYMYLSWNHLQVFLLK